MSSRTPDAKVVARGVARSVLQNVLDEWVTLCEMVETYASETLEYGQDEFDAFVENVARYVSEIEGNL